MRKTGRGPFKVMPKLCVSVFILLAALGAWAQNGNNDSVIVLMFDGAGATVPTVARWYKGAPLNVDSMYLSGVRTYGADSIITDSAPAATAFACGVKSDDKYVGIMPSAITVPVSVDVSDSLKYKPVASVLEGARLAGKSTGMIATSNVQHASPAGYSSHVVSRSDYNEIGEQQVYGNVDVCLSGGSWYLLPTSLGGKRTDGANLVDVLKARGYGYVQTKAEMEAFTGKKLWGMFANDALAYDLDRPRFAPTQPSLSEMTSKAIELLKKNSNGFFLFVEGSKVDWADHANDPVASVTDFLAFDEAVGVALNYAKAHEGTMVLVFADHATGGMTLGNASTSDTYSHLQLESLLTHLKAAKLTGEGIELALGADRSESSVRTVMEQEYSISDLTPEEVAAIQAAPAGSMNYVVGPIISQRSSIGWTTNGHTGEDIFFWYYGYKKPLRLIENTDIAKMCAHRMGFDLQDVDKKLFVEAGQAFAGTGATLAIDATDPANKALVATKGTKSARIPFATDLIHLADGTKHKDATMKGIAVYISKTGKAYVPKEAAALFQDF